MQTLKKKPLPIFFSATKPSAGFKTILQDYVNRDSQLSNKESITDLQEDLAVKLIYCDEAIRGATTLFRVLKNYPVLKKLNYAQHPNTNKIMFGTAHCFVTPEDRKYAMKRLSTLRGEPGA